MSENTAERTLPVPSERPLRFLRLPDVVAMIGLSRSTIYYFQARGEFPKRVKLSERTAVWVETEVLDWMTSRIEARERES